MLRRCTRTARRAQRTIRSTDGPGEHCSSLRSRLGAGLASDTHRSVLETAPNSDPPPAEAGIEYEGWPESRVLQSFSPVSARVRSAPEFHKSVFDRRAGKFSPNPIAR